MSRSILAVLTLLLCRATTVFAIPAIHADPDALSQEKTTIVPDSLDHLSALVDTAPDLDEPAHPLFKRHEWFLICGELIQDSRLSAPFEGAEDIKLSRTCLGAPYKYTCDGSMCSSAFLKAAHIKDPLLISVISQRVTSVGE